MAFSQSVDIYGSDHLGLATNPFASIIDVPRGREYLYNKMPAPGGHSVQNPGSTFNERTGHVVEISFVKGKKKLKRVRLKKDEDHQLTLDEASESVKLMFKFLKQQNKRLDLEWEEAELNKFSNF